MPRLIDDIRAAGRMAVPWCVSESKLDLWQKHAQQCWDLLQKADLPVVLIDNVAQYYFMGTDQEYWDLCDDFPNLAPPFELAWFEHRAPRLIHSREKGDTDVAATMPRGRVGFLVFGTERENLVGEIADNARWVLSIELFIDYDRGDIQGPHGTIHLAIDAEGKLVAQPWMQTFCDESQGAQVAGYVGFCHPAFLAISFMHCKNVSFIDESVPKPLAKKYHARTGIWPAKYKTLEIRPLQEILRREGKSESTGLRHAMHICRGHFRDYRQGKGLFGKYKTVVWTPATVRGTKSGTKAPEREYEIKL